MPWEEKGWEYPNNFASPLQIIIDASNGASDYGNKFGEPIVSGIFINFINELATRPAWEFIPEVYCLNNKNPLRELKEKSLETATEGDCLFCA